MAKSTERIQKYLTEVEEAAEDIISDQQEIVALDRRRNTNREALRQLQTSSTNPSSISTQNSGAKDWICIGNMFMKLPRPFVVDSIEKEQKQLDTEIRNLRNGLRNKVNQLNDLEDKQEILGTNIKPLSHEEWKAVRQALGRLE